jgi:hypothetical protein
MDHDYIGPYSITLFNLQIAAIVWLQLIVIAFHIRNCFFFKTDKKGKVVWAKRFWNDTLRGLRPRCVIITADSGYLITELHGMNSLLTFTC